LLAVDLGFGTVLWLALALYLLALGTAPRWQPTARPAP
jgi:hypothetical protein